MEHIYAQIDQEGQCVGVSFLAGPVESPLMIPITMAEVVVDGDCLGKVYQNGKWVVPNE